MWDILPIFAADMENGKFMKRLRAIVVLIGWWTAAGMEAQNPYLPLWEHIPDGEPYVFEDPDRPGAYRVYVYGSHDNLVDAYCGRDQVVWSASVDSLSHWRYDGIVFESKRNRQGSFLDKDGLGDVLYAPDVVEKVDGNGKKTYYLYPNNQGRGRASMVAKANRPDGPFEVCNWSTKNPDRTEGPLGFDPAVFIDDDGRVYGYWGFDTSWGAELDAETMATLKAGCEPVKDLIPSRHQPGDFRFFEASSMRKIKDKYVFIYSRWTHDGEFGLPASNYTLAYAYGDAPLGPFRYGGTIIDGRARGTDWVGNAVYTAHPDGNMHGSIVEIKGQWYVFYHRQCGTDQYSRQAMVAPIEVEVMEGPGGRVWISEGEYTSEGFATEGLDPTVRHSAGIACYYTGPEGAASHFPDYVFSGSYVQAARPQYDGRSDTYDLTVNHNPVVNNTTGSIVGYKYFNLSNLKKSSKVVLQLQAVPTGIAGKIEIWIDSPWQEQGGQRLGIIDIKGGQPRQMTTFKAKVPAAAKLQGKHALYLRFVSDTPEQSLCDLHYLQFAYK